jgi:hypothetical protein
MSVCYECRLSGAGRLGSWFGFLPTRHGLKQSSTSVWNLRKWFRLLFTAESAGRNFNGRSTNLCCVAGVHDYFQICRSQFQIIGAITWSRLHCEDLQFWSDLWSSLLPGAFYWMHVNRCVILFGRGKSAVPELKIFDVTKKNLVAPVTGISAPMRLAARRVGVC